MSERTPQIGFIKFDGSIILLFYFELEAETTICVDEPIFGEVRIFVKLFFDKREIIAKCAVKFTFNFKVFQSSLRVNHRDAEVYLCVVRVQV